MQIVDAGRFPILADFPLRRYPHDLLLPRVWELRNNLTACDAVYVALAEALDAPLLTSDKRLATAVGHHARVELVRALGSEIDDRSLADVTIGEVRRRSSSGEWTLMRKRLREPPTRTGR
jgi:hypothetical protein